MDSLFPKAPTNRRVGGRSTNHRVGNTLNWLREPQKISLQHGHTTTMKVKDVCRSCNTGWMSRVDDEAKPLISSLIKGEAGIIDVPGQQLIARWITQKVMAAESLHLDMAGISQAQRSYLYLCRRVPPRFWIWISPFAGPSTATIFHASAGLHDQPLSPPNLDARNTQLTVWTLGKLLVVVISTSNQAITLRGPADVNQAMFRLWPPLRTPLDWRLGNSLGNAEAQKFTNLLERLLSTPNVWARS